MENHIEIHGFCDEKFIPFKEAFIRNFEEGLEVGASLAVTVDGEYVVDLWGGYTSHHKKNFWEKNTLVCVFSTTKIMTVLCALILVDRGELNLDSPISKYWPEFSQAGKEKMPVRYIFSHSTGLAGFDEVLAYEDLYDWDKIVDILARQKPWWEPGTASGYHALTFGFLLGELIRRISGKTVGYFLRTEVTEKLKSDFYIGLPEQHHSRVAKPVWVGDGRYHWYEPDSISAKAWENPAAPGNKTYLSKEFLTAEIPSINGHGNAYSIARLGSILALSGELDGTHFLSKETIEKVLEEQIYVTDLVICEPVRWGLGLSLRSKEWPRSYQFPNPTTIHWGGFGGSYCVMDLDARICIAYAMNRMDPTVAEDPRGDNIGLAWIDCTKNL
jgi:CubicO group peptidase (beta-lactamase class C family)